MMDACTCSGLRFRGRALSFGESPFYSDNNKPAYYPETDITSPLRLLTANATLRNGLGKGHSGLGFLTEPEKMYSDIFRTHDRLSLPMINMSHRGFVFGIFNKLL